MNSANTTMYAQAVADRDEAQDELDRLKASNAPLAEFYEGTRALLRRIREATRVIETIQRNTPPEDLA